jgi:hypothetical protein
MGNERGDIMRCIDKEAYESIFDFLGCLSEKEIVTLAQKLGFSKEEIQEWADDLETLIGESEKADDPEDVMRVAINELWEIGDYLIDSGEQGWRIMRVENEGAKKR